MKVAGFTIIKNAVKYGYPVVESILSALPLCDAFYVSIGDGDDTTEELIRGIQSNKIIILHSVWNQEMNKKGMVLAWETNKLFQQIPPEFDWCLYLQADEILHEQDYQSLTEFMKNNLNNLVIDGILLKYRHFWGSFDYVGTSSRWYRNEIRIIRNDKSFYSYRDAQGFRKQTNRKLRVVRTNAYVYHYGWVRPPQKMQVKIEGVQQYWSNEHKAIQQTEEFDYHIIDGLTRFLGTHPSSMASLIAAQKWEFHFDKTKNVVKPKEWLKQLLYKLTGRRFFEYRNYIIVEK